VLHRRKNTTSASGWLRGMNWPSGLNAMRADYLTHLWSGFEAPGRYTIIVGWTKPNSLAGGRIDEGDVLALNWKALWFGPQQVASR
jgi:hypothetical protein